MFADPAVVTVDGTPYSLAKINQDKYSSEYLLRFSDSESKLSIRNNSYLDKKRKVMIDRHNVEFVETIFPVAPSTTSFVRKAYVVIENQQGDDLTASIKDALGLIGFLTEANLTKLLNFQS
jgi:hypothetical protein